MGDATAERFRERVRERFGFLEARGFHRSPADEDDSPVGASVVYAGRHVGFRISHDVRDHAVDVRVARARNGRLAGREEGGYSENLLAHLVTHAGYRGGVRAPSGARAAGSGTLEAMVDAWAELLEREGGALLADREGSLP